LSVYIILQTSILIFAFETTLASRTFAPWIDELRKTDYDFHLVFLWLPNEDFAIARVAERVAWAAQCAGGNYQAAVSCRHSKFF